ncbi:15722_t:CDS:1, partial [Racocetra fulgida]
SINVNDCQLGSSDAWMIVDGKIGRNECGNIFEERFSGEVKSDKQE